MPLNYIKGTDIKVMGSEKATNLLKSAQLPEFDIETEEERVRRIISEVQPQPRLHTTFVISKPLVDIIRLISIG